MSSLSDWIYNNFTAHGDVRVSITWNKRTAKSILPIFGGWHCCCNIILDIRLAFFLSFEVNCIETLHFVTVTYGAITVLQVMGYEDGIRVLERTQPLALIIGLPSIPVALVLSQFLKWDDILSNIILKCIATFSLPYSNRPWATFILFTAIFTINTPQANWRFVIIPITKWNVHTNVWSENFVFCTIVANRFYNCRTSI